MPLLVAVRRKGIPADRDFRRLLSLNDRNATTIGEYYSRWLPTASGVPAATLVLQNTDMTHTRGSCVSLNVAVDSGLPTRPERLAFLHATMWHEAAHVRHPVSAPWFHRLLESTRLPTACVEAAAQTLEDIRVERELIGTRPEARRWLRYNLSSGHGLTANARALGSAADCGWGLTATMFIGRVVSGVLDKGALTELCQACPELDVESQRLWPLWDGYVRLSDPERDEGGGDRYVHELALVLRDSV